MAEKNAPPPEGETLTPVEEHRLRKENRELRSKAKRLAEQLAEATDGAAASAMLHDTELPRTLLPVGKAKGRPRAIPCMIWSDWHVEENVVSDKVNGLNSYSLDIAEGRVKKLVEGCLWHMKMHASHYHLDGALIHLGGDLMTGWIHSELVETSMTSPIETLNWLFVIVSEALNRMAADAPVKGEIKVICTPGNHGRMTTKNRTANKAETSLEWLLYQRLVHEYKDHKRITVWAPKSIWTYVQLYDFTLRFGHGDEMTKGMAAGTGVGGITIPLNKAINRLNQGRQADCTIVGHWHQLTWAPELIVNGSLIGVTPYSLRYGHEEPQQAYWLVVDGRGRSAQTPIWVRDRKETHSPYPLAPSEAQWARTGWTKPPDFSQL